MQCVWNWARGSLKSMHTCFLALISSILIHIFMWFFSYSFARDHFQSSEFSAVLSVTELYMMLFNIAEGTENHLHYSWHYFQRGLHLESSSDLLSLSHSKIDTAWFPQWSYTSGAGPKVWIYFLRTVHFPPTKVTNKICRFFISENSWISWISIIKDKKLVIYVK